MDIKAITRERMELRGHLSQSITTILETLRTTTPSSYAPSPGKEGPIEQTQWQSLWRDWVDKASPVVAKVIKCADLMADDTIAILEGVLAEIKRTSENKQSPSGV